MNTTAAHQALISTQVEERVLANLRNKVAIETSDAYLFADSLAVANKHNIRVVISVTTVADHQMMVITPR